MTHVSKQPPGLVLTTDFVTEEFEKKVLETFLSELEWPDRNGRRSLHYGYTFCYKTFKIDRDIPYEPFPPWLNQLLPPGETELPDQVCIQHYPPGAGIPPHADTHSAFDQLYSLSLGSPILMQFAHPETGEKLDVDLPARSMAQFSGDVRLHWTHSIRARKTDPLSDGTVRLRQDRWSITYRWLRPGGVCDCGDLRLCDTAKEQQGIEKEYRWKEAAAA